MKTSILKSKIKRNNLEEYAEQYFRNENSQIVSSLNNEGKSALFGIEREDGIYTIIGEKSVYYTAASGNKGEITLNEFSEILHHNAMQKGKGGNFEFLQINNQGDLLWLYNRETMNALWNIILWINR
jgi:hypothetical protein